MRAALNSCTGSRLHKGAWPQQKEAESTQRKEYSAHSGVTGTNGSLDKAAITYSKDCSWGGSLPGFLSGWVGNKESMGKRGEDHIPRVPCFSPGGQSSLILHQNPRRYYQAEGEERGQNSSERLCRVPRAWPIMKARQQKG